MCCPLSRCFRGIAAGLSLLVLVAGEARAGSLEPAPGPVGPTMKPLDQIEPRRAVQSLSGSVTAMHRIGESGSYYLTGDLVADGSGKNGIEIEANDVTLDLMGFSMVGDGSGRGIFLIGDRTNVVVHNGTLRSWSGGIVGSTSNNLACQARDLSVLDNGGDGLVLGVRSKVTNCVVRGTVNEGIQVGAHSIVTGCIVSGNGGEGLTTGDGALVSQTVAEGNGSNGIQVGNYCRIESSRAESNGSHGIVGFNGTLVTSVSATGNVGDGIQVSTGSTVVDSLASNNIGDGIQVSQRTRVAGNTSTLNGAGGDGAGVHATGRNNTIEGNTVSLNDRGIDTDTTNAEGNAVIRNIALCNGGSSSTDATNYAVDGNDVVAPRTTTAGTSTNPWENLSVHGATPCS